MSNTERWVLIADASPEGRAELRRRLGAGGLHHCGESASGAAAIQACLGDEADPPDCLLLVHSPPRCDAGSVLAALGGTAAPRCPVVLLERGESGGGVAWLWAGAHEVAGLDSTTPAELARAVERAIARFELNRAAHAGRDDAAGACRQLERNRAIYQAMLDGARNFLLAYLDRDFNFVRVNAAYAQTCGHTPEAMAGLNHFDLYPHPENQAIFAQVRDTGLPAEFHDKPFVFPDRPECGLTYWDWTLIPDKAPDGEVRGLVLSLVETTGRRRAEQQIVRLNQDLRRRVEELQTVFDTAPIGLVICTDPEGRHIRGNAANERALGVPAGSELSKMAPQCAPYRVFRDGRELRPMDLPMQQAVRGNAVVGRVMDVERPDGGRITLHCNATPLLDEAGQPRGAVGAFVDITDLRLTEDRLRQREASYRLLSGIAGRLLATDDPEAMIGQMCREIMQHLDCQVFINFLLDDETGRLCLKSCAGLSDALIERIGWLCLDEAVCGCACVGAKPFAGDRIQNAFDLRAALLGDHGIRAYYCHPLMADNRIIGLLSFGTRTRACFTDDETDLMRTVADQVALAMQRVESQRILCESESFYRQVLESIPGVVFTARPDGYCDYPGQQWIDYTGLPERESLGYGWSGALHPEDRRRVLNAWQAAVEGRAPYDIEYRVRRHDGLYEWFKARARPIRNEAGQIVRWFGTAFNIERMKRIELNARFVNQLAAELALLTDGDEIFRRVVIGVAEHLGVWRCLIGEVDYPAGVCIVNHDWCQDGTSVAGMYCQDNFAEPEVLATLAAGGAVAIADIHADSRTASYADAYEPHEVRALLTVPFLGDRGWQGALTVQAREPRIWREDEVQLVRSVVARTWPAVQRARGLAALRASEERLREADRRKDEFLAMLAHELRNPLAPIRNAVFLLKRVATDEPRIAWCRDIIERQADQLTRLVDDLLDVSRITRGKIELKPEPLDVADIVQRAVEICRPLVDARRHALEVVPTGESLRVEGDLVRLAQVLSNLLNNAAKYTDEGGHIRLETERDDDHVLIRVRDNGRGIEPAALPNLFDLFYQVDRTLDRSEGGLGIGLSLVKRLVDMHGGEVWAYSAGRGMGTEFVIRLPHLPDPPDHAQAAPDAAARVEDACRILVVDDNVDAAESLAMLLEFDGHSVALVHEGREAVELALAERPDVVLLDIGLPGLNGYEACRRMRAGGLTDALIVAMTGYGQENDRRQSEQAGFDVHLVKPVDLGEIEALIGQARGKG